jgi:protein required for attachment to host cells
LQTGELRKRIDLRQVGSSVICETDEVVSTQEKTMKQLVTWIVLANSREVSLAENRGPGKGVHLVEGQTWQAEPVELPRDEAGVGHSIAGPGKSAVEQKDPQHKAEMGLAKEVCDALAKAFTAKKFDRLILVAGPKMLGLLRSKIDDSLVPAIAGEIAKDLSAQPMDALERQIGEVIAV